MSFTYRGLKAVLERHIVTDAEIDKQLEYLQQQNLRIALIDDRPTQNGDEIVLDYAGYCNGVQFPGGTAQDQTLVLGSGQFIPGFEEQLLDKVPGEEVIVKVTFPAAYHAPDLAGKDAEFHCAVKQIRVKTPYELDDTFAREVGGCDTFEEMRQRLGESLQAYSDQRGEMDLQDRLLRQAAETLDVTISDEQIEKELDEQMQNLTAQLAQQGLNLEMYCQFMSTTEEKLREDARSNAVQSVRVQLAVEEIGRLEGITPTDEDIAQALALIARQNRMTVEELKPHYDAEFEAAVMRSIVTGKVMELIRAAAEITEK